MKQKKYKKILILLTIIFMIALCWITLRPFGLLWLIRTGGWDSWEKELKYTVNENGLVEVPIDIDWDFVDLIIIPKNKSKDEQITIKVINKLNQSISVRCGKRNKDNTGIESETLIHKITKKKTVFVYRGSLIELFSKWIPIHISGADGGNKFNVVLSIESKNGSFNKDSIPFTVVAKWWSYGL